VSEQAPTRSAGAPVLRRNTEGPEPLAHSPRAGGSHGAPAFRAPSPQAVDPSGAPAFQAPWPRSTRELPTSARGGRRGENNGPGRGKMPRRRRVTRRSRRHRTGTRVRLWRRGRGGRRAPIAPAIALAVVGLGARSGPTGFGRSCHRMNPRPRARLGRRVRLPSRPRADVPADARPLTLPRERASRRVRGGCGNNCSSHRAVGIKFWHGHSERVECYRPNFARGSTAVGCMDSFARAGRSLTTRALDTCRRRDSSACEGVDNTWQGKVTIPHPTSMRPCKPSVR